MSYACFKQSHPPTGVEYCIQANFTGENDTNLILAKTSFLQVYTLENNNTGGGTTTTPHLSLVFEKTFFGNIESLCAVRMPGSKTDNIVLSFRDAKVSVLSWDLENYDLKIASMHYYEKPELQEGYSRYRCRPIVRMDPLSRCAAVLFYDRQFAIIPFQNESSSILDDEPKSGASENPSFIIDLPKLNICNVKDFIFLEGYYEPTVLILHEPRQTWVGRIAARKETCIVTALSLNISQKLHPVIWTVDHLPSTAETLVAVPEPLGGALVLCCNHLLYFNQSIKYGLTLNEYAYKEKGTFPLDEAKPVIALDSAVCTFISENSVLISLKNGELYLCHLASDGRYLRSMHIVKAGASVLPSCMCRLSTDLVCLGSRLGDTLLIKFAPKLDPAKTIKGENDENGENEPPGKRMKISQDSEDLFEKEEKSELDFLRDNEFQEEAASQTTALQYTFAVWESILNLGPISDSIVGESQDPASNSHNDGTDTNRRRQIELVTCSGHGKNGSLCVLQRSIRPDLVTPFDVPGCRAVWTVFSDAPVDEDAMDAEPTTKVKKEKKKKNNNNNNHNGDDAEPKGTDNENENGVDSPNGENQQQKEKEQEEEIEEEEEEEEEEKIDMTQFHAYLVISRDDSTMILSTGEELREITDRVGFSVKRPTVYVGNVCGIRRIVQVCEKSVKLLQGVNVVTEVPIHRTILSASSIDNFILLKMDNGAIQILEATEDNLKRKEVPALAPFTASSTPIIASATLFRDNAVNPFFGTTPSLPYLVVAFTEGTVCIYRLSDFSLCFYFPSVSSAPAVLSHHEPSLSSSSSSIKASSSQEPALVEVAVLFSGSSTFQHTPPHIVSVLDNNDILVYRGFYPGNVREGSPRFAKVEHGLITRGTADENNSLGNLQRIFRFDDIAGRMGAFVAGPNPVFLFLERTHVRVHPMDLDGFVPCFTSFHNLQCSHGFIYCNYKGVLKICQLPAHMTYSSHWPYRKVPVKMTPHKIAYHADTRVYVAGLSLDVVDNTDPMISSDTQMGVPSPEEPPALVNTVANNPKVPPPLMSRFELRIFAPHSNISNPTNPTPNSNSDWSFADRFQFDVHEHILALRVVMLRSDDGGHKSYIAVGTGYVQGEDMACKGRILVFEVMREHPPRIELLTQEEQDQQEDRIFFRLAATKEQKGPISALAALEGYLIVATGPKVIVYNFFNGKDLVGAAFFDAQIFIVSLNTVKNWIVVGDAYKSIYFLRWKEEPVSKSITLLAKDFQHLNIYATEYLIEQQTLGITVTDASKNVLLFSYAPTLPESRSGQMLLCKADFHIGSHVNKLTRIPLLPPGPQPRHALVFGTLDGALGYLRPLEEATFKKLAALQSKLMTAIPHAAGLNPRAFRLAKFGRRSGRVHQKHILDGELLWKFLHLDRAKMREIGLAIGADPDTLISSIKDIDQPVCFF